MVLEHLRQARSISAMPIHLSSEELKNPESVIQEFYNNWDLSQLREELENWLTMAFSADLPELNDCFVRSRLMELCYELEALAEAVYVIYEMAGQTEEPTDSKKTKRKKLK